MRMLRALAAAAACFGGLLGMVLPDTSVELKNVHLCCGNCEKAAGKILEESGAKGTGDATTKSIRFTAADEKAAQKTLDALAAGGFHGDTGTKDLAIQDDSGAKEGKIASAVVKGFHNCCPACCKAIKAVLAKVEGVESEDTKPRERSCTVKGNFDAAKLVKALNDAGFHATLEAGK